MPPNWQSTYAEISNVKGNIFNILGIHITPPKITSNDVGNIINSSLRNKKNGYKKFKRKLVTYGKQMDLQNLQAIKISKIVEQFKDPTILAGDFNSTPEMPMHYRFRKIFNDSWIQSGNGFGHTRNWAGIIPLRIDYIYTSKGLNSSYIKTLDHFFSDHKPIISIIQTP